MPRRKSAAARRLPPARCSSVSAQRALAAGDDAALRPPAASTAPGAPVPAAQRGAPDLHLVSPRKQRARARRRAQARTGARVPRWAVVQSMSRVVLVDLARIARAGRGLRHGRARRPRCRRARARSPRRRARPACRAAICASSSSAIGERDAARSIGPVSSPASICMMVMPVSRSPASSARWIGAAPRQRGSSEAWMLSAPCGGDAEHARGGSIRP